MDSPNLNDSSLPDNGSARGPMVKEFLWWCSGADNAILRRCPKDQRLYTAHGLFVALDTLLAWVAGYKVMWIAFDTYVGAVIFATVLAAVLFWLYRYTLVSLRSDGKIAISRDEVRGNALPMLVAVVFGVAIAIPLELIIFAQDIAAQGVPAEGDLNAHIAALTAMAMEGYRPWFGAWGGLGCFLDAMLHWWWVYLFSSLQGLITLLVVLLNICPIFLKMRSADGDYERLLGEKNRKG